MWVSFSFIGLENCRILRSNEWFVYKNSEVNCSCVIGWKDSMWPRAHLIFVVFRFCFEMVYTWFVLTWLTLKTIWPNSCLFVCFLNIGKTKQKNKAECHWGRSSCYIQKIALSDSMYPMFPHKCINLTICNALNIE